MRWFVKDIRVTPKGDGASYSTEASWDGMKGVGEDGVVHLCNACDCNFFIKNAPCKVVATGSIGTSISRGTGGTVDAPVHGTPWVRRFESCLAALSECTGAIIGVIDAPPPEHIYQAFEAVAKHAEVLMGLHSVPNKVLILCGPEVVMYPLFNTPWPAPDDSPTPPTVTYCNAKWREFVESVEWGTVVHSGTGADRMMVTLSRMLGSYQLCTPGHVLLPYPSGSSCPKGTMQYSQFSKNIDNTTVRCSSTRGIAVRPTNSAEVSATVVLQDESDIPEEPEMTLMRQMITSDDPSEVGAACFKLNAAKPKSAILQIATRSIMHEHVGSRLVDPPPMLRQASIAHPHTTWR